MGFSPDTWYVSYIVNSCSKKYFLIPQNRTTIYDFECFFRYQSIVNSKSLYIGTWALRVIRQEFDFMDFWMPKLRIAFYSISNRVWSTQLHTVRYAFQTIRFFHVFLLAAISPSPHHNCEFMMNLNTSWI